MTNYLSHHGINGQKWGLQNGPPYPLDRSQMSAAELRKADRLDKKWSRKYSNKINKAVYKMSKGEADDYAYRELSGVIKKFNKDGKISANYANAYNKKLAEIMNRNVGELHSPSGRVIQFVAKRGEIGVYTALADIGYDMAQVRNGVYGSGKVAYKKSHVDSW